MERRDSFAARALEGEAAAPVPPASGPKVLLVLLAVGLVLVLSVGTFAALTRPPRVVHPPGLPTPPPSVTPY